MENKFFNFCACCFVLTIKAQAPLLQSNGSGKYASQPPLIVEQEKHRLWNYRVSIHTFKGHGRGCR